MTFGDRVARLYDALPTEEEKDFLCRMLWAIANGTKEQVNELYEAAKSGIGREGLLPYIERIETG